MDRFGDPFTRNGMYHYLRHIAAIEGNKEEEVARASNEIRIGSACSDAEFVCWGCYGLANVKARCGELSDAHQMIQKGFEVIRGRDSRLTESVLHNHQAYVELQSSEYRGARVAAERSRRLSERCFLFIEFMTRAYGLLVESLLGPHWSDPRRDADVRYAKRIARIARIVAWRSPNHRPHVQRVLGRLQCVLGRIPRAKKHLKNSIEHARAMGAEYDLARALLDLSVLDQPHRDALRTEATAILKRIQAVIPRAESWQLGDNPDAECIAPPWEPDATTNPKSSAVST
jgi:hypothetical protein